MFTPQESRRQAIWSSISTSARLGGKLAEPSELPCDVVAHGEWAELSEHVAAVHLPDDAAAPSASAGALLLWSSSTGRYSLWRLGPRKSPKSPLPEPTDAPLARGVWADLAGRTLLGLGGGTLLAYSPSSGDYRLLALDTSIFKFVPPISANYLGDAENSPSVAHGELARGSLGGAPAAAPLARRCARRSCFIRSVGLVRNGARGSRAVARTARTTMRRGLPFPPRSLSAPRTPFHRRCALLSHSLSALGDDLFLDSDRESDAYCVLRLTRHAPATPPPLSAVGAGRLDRRPCDHDT